MNRWQKIAWYNIIVISVTFSLTGICVGALTIKYGFPVALSGLGILGLLGLLGLSGVIFKKKKSHVDFDERDKEIHIKATRAGFASSYGFVGLICMGTWAVIGPKGMVTVNLLPNIFIGAMITMIIVQSITILVKYGRGEKENDNE